MSHRWLPFTALLLAAPAAAQQVLVFDDPSGLRAEAEFTLLDGGTTLQVRLRNLSTGVPGGFDNSDQLLTSISFDLGAPGENAGDPKIVGGSVALGAASMSVNFSETAVGPGDDVSGEYGYGNGGTTGLLPNFLTAMAAGSTPFGGPNLDGPVILDGPQAGLVASPNLVPLGGLGAIQDEVVGTLLLDQAVTSFDFLRDNGATVEYGSDAAFVTEFPCDDVASVDSIQDSNGYNLEGGLYAEIGEVPSLGSTFTVKVDDPDDSCGLDPGALTFVLVSESLATPEIVIANLGCTLGTPGAILVDITKPFHHAGTQTWAGPGNPTCHSFQVGYLRGACGLTCIMQGFFLDTGGPSPRIVATNALAAHIGSQP